MQLFFDLYYKLGLELFYSRDNTCNTLRKSMSAIQGTVWILDKLIRNI